MNMENDKKVRPHLRVSLFFEVSDSELFGGIGTVGYMEAKLEADAFHVDITEEYINYQLQNVVEIAEIPVEKIRMISKKEYDANTED